MTTFLTSPLVRMLARALRRRRGPAQSEEAGPPPEMPATATPAVAEPIPSEAAVPDPVGGPVEDTDPSSGPRLSPLMSAMQL